MSRAYNFGPGPAALPLSVLEEAAAELTELPSAGTSVLELSHRSVEYDEIHSGMQLRLKRLLGLGEDYHVLLTSGGASLQFAAVPMNLLGDGQTADYVVTGSWSKKALKEAQALGNINVAADITQDGAYTRIPRPEECSFSSGAAYVHITSNNTICGTQYATYPKTEAPLVADMSSDILSRPLPAQEFGLIYAGAQKNLGPAGVTVVVIRSELLERCKGGIPSMLAYPLLAKSNSLNNTPPCFNIYMVGKVLTWIEDQGGLEAIGQRNQGKADLLYQTVDRHADFYRAPVAKDSRSAMNAVFRLPTEELEKRFVSEAKQANMIGLKGHRSVGGIRVSLYNAVEPAWVETLTSFMDEFVRRNG